jgi:hypothetical protein
MGYFRSQEDAEKLLDLVREIYPAAWAGLAPGQKLRESHAADPAQNATRPAPASAPAAAIKPDASAATQSLNSVRAAIASLGDEPARPRPAVVAVPAAPIAPTTALPPKNIPTLSDSQVLRVLEAPKPPAHPVPAGKPRNELTLFAVQLLWSVQPINMRQVQQLAIFGAYTLYGAEGNRDGRRWYGLRLGFFTDALSAKQVAQYVRSEYNSVSVVPVTIRERERALAAAQPPPAPANTLVVTHAPGVSGQFKLLDESKSTARVQTTASLVTAKAPVKAANGKSSPGKRAKDRVGQKPKSGTNGKSRKGELSLEETLEILGASELQMDEGRGELLNDSGVRHLQLEMNKSPSGSALGRLIGRLTERLGD